MSKKLIFLVILIAIPVVLWTQCGQGRIGATTPQRVVVIGDSLSAGIPSDGLTERWPEMLERMLGPDAQVVNMSFPGDTAGQAMDRWGEAVSNGAFTDESGWEPDLFILLLGGNDILQRRGRNAMVTDLRAWAQLVQRFNVDVLFIEVPGGLIGDEYRGAWDDLAAEFGFHSMGQRALRRVFTNNEYRIDRTHMNRAGHEFFATQVFNRIEGR